MTISQDLVIKELARVVEEIEFSVNFGFIPVEMEGSDQPVYSAEQLRDLIVNRVIHAAILGRFLTDDDAANLRQAVVFKVEEDRLNG